MSEVTENSVVATMEHMHEVAALYARALEHIRLLLEAYINGETAKIPAATQTAEVAIASLKSHTQRLSL